MDLSRRDFIKKLKDIGIGIGIVSLVPGVLSPELPEPVEMVLEEAEFPWMDPDVLRTNIEEAMEKLIRQNMISANSGASAYSVQTFL